jgi:DNA repair protein RecN (Recombination protein N)
LLALKACFSQVDPTGTMVFDEIDTGVSGKVAQAIAEKLYQLGQRHQVLCVTHQPLIAAMATTHFRVVKQVIDAPAPPTRQAGKSRRKSRSTTPSEPPDKPSDTGDDVRTVVRVTPLEMGDRQQEIAALIGGDPDKATSFAASLLDQATHTRQAIAPDVAAGNGTQSTTAPADAAPAATPSTRKRAASRRKPSRSK